MTKDSEYGQEISPLKSSSDKPTDKVKQITNDCSKDILAAGGTVKIS